MPLKQKLYHGLLDLLQYLICFSQAKQTWSKQTIMSSDNSNLSIVQRNGHTIIIPPITHLTYKARKDHIGDNIWYKSLHFTFYLLCLATSLTYPYHTKSIPIHMGRYGIVHWHNETSARYIWGCCCLVICLMICIDKQIRAVYSITISDFFQGCLSECARSFLSELRLILECELSADPTSSCWFSSFFEFRNRPPHPLALFRACKCRDSCKYGWNICLKIKYIHRWCMESCESNKFTGNHKNIKKQAHNIM